MTGYVPPPTVWDGLAERRAVAAGHPGGLIDLSIGTPVDPPPPQVASILADAARGDGRAARAYPASIGSLELREAAAGWLQRRFGVSVSPDLVAASIGSKELVAGVPHWLRLRRPDRDVVLHPAVAYPTYAVGAALAGCRSVAVPVAPDGSLDLAALDPAEVARAVCLWSNSPSNPTGALDDLEAVAEWGRRHDVPVLSDECYAELTWDGPPRTILAHGVEGVLAVHSLSKRSNLAGLRVGFYAGDPELVAYLSQLRKHAGFMVPGPVQAVAAALYDDDVEAQRQRERYRHRIDAVRSALAAVDEPCPDPAGAFYLWQPAPDGDGDALADRWARERGVLVTPGRAYGPDGAGHVRLALVVDPVALDDLVARIGSAG